MVQSRQDSEELRRLVWQCRRGMLELDHLFAGFIESGYAGLDADERALFVALLREQDTELSDWFMGRTAAPPAYAALVARIVETVSAQAAGR